MVVAAAARVEGSAAEAGSLREAAAAVAAEAVVVAAGDGHMPDVSVRDDLQDDTVAARLDAVRAASAAA